MAYFDQLLVIPSKHYDISGLANKIDSIRNTNEITASIAEYRKILSDEEIL